MAGMDRVKRRGMNFQPGVDSRQLRAHRRSVERRSFRRSMFDLQRADLVPLEDVVEESAAANVQLTLVEAQQLSRREKLRRWKEEKVLKKKLEAEKRAAKPLFKVCHLEHRPPLFIQPNLPVVSARNRRMPATNDVFEKRVTRAETARARAAAVAAEVRPAKPISKAALPGLTLTTRQTRAKTIQNLAAVEQLLEAPVTATEAAASASEERPVEFIDDVATSEHELPKSRVSFAPLNFQFVAPVLKRYSQQPPSSTVVVADHLHEDIAMHQTAGISQNTTEVEDDTVSFDMITQPPVSVTADADLPPDVSHFRNLVLSYSTQLRELCEEWSTVLNTEDSLSDGVVGRIRSVVGKANLLMNERFDQFAQLVDDCELVRGDKVTTCSDLQGFWEMVFPQVEECLEKFQKLANIRSNNFQDEETPIKMMPKLKREPKAVETRSNKVNDGEHKRAARLRLANFKKVMAGRKKVLESFVVSQDVTAILPTASTNLDSSDCTAPPVISPASFSKAEHQKTTKKISLCQTVLQRNFLMDDAETRSSPRRRHRLSGVSSPLVTEQQMKTESDSLKNVSVNVMTSGKQALLSPKLNRKSDLIRFSDVFSMPDAKENIAQNPFTEYLALVDAEQYPDSSFNE